MKSQGAAKNEANNAAQAAAPVAAPEKEEVIDSCGMLLSAIHEEEGEEKLHLLMVDDHIPAGAKLY